MHIFAEGRSSCCFIKCSSDGAFAISFSSAAAMRSFISAAAAFVKVTINSLSALEGRSLSVRRSMTRSTRTAVLPEPAAALTSTLPSLAPIA